MRRVNSVVVVFASALVLVAGLGSAETLNLTSMTSNEAAQQPCEEQGSFVVAEVPRTGVPGGAVAPTQGRVVQGSRVQALPGFVLQPAPNNSVSIKPTGGGLGVTNITCHCSIGNGTCTVVTHPTISTCDKGTGDTCSGSCAFVTISTGLRGAVMY